MVEFQRNTGIILLSFNKGLAVLFYFAAIVIMEVKGYPGSARNDFFHFYFKNYKLINWPLIIPFLFH